MTDEGAHLWLSRGARTTRVVFGLGVFVLAARFAVESAVWASEQLDEPAPQNSWIDPAQTQPNPLVPRLDAAALESLARAQLSAAPSASAPPPVEKRTLIVNLGPPRSPVYINGVKRGQTPYAGDYSCRVGDEIRIQVLPRGAMPLEATATCGGSVIRAAEPSNVPPR